MSQTLLKIVAGLAVLLLVLVAIALKYGGGEADLNPIAEAAERTAAMPGAKMSLTADYSTPDRNLTFSAQGEGEMNWRTDRGRATLTTSLAGHEITVETITDADTIYLRTSAPDQGLPPGKEWVGVEPFLGHEPDTALAGSADAGEILRSLESTGGDTEDLGEETVRGVETTHYRATIEQNRLEEKLRSEGKADVAKLVEHSFPEDKTSIPVEVWIDGEGIVRRIREVMPLENDSGGTALTMDMRMEFYDFGTEPEISLPPASKVFDATPLVKAKLGSTDAPGESPPASGAGPTSGRPLSRASFQARVNGICGEMQGEADRLKHESRPLLQRWQRVAKRADLQATLQAGQDVARGYFKPFLELVQRWIDRVSALAPPSSMAAEYRRYLKLNGLEAEDLRADTHAMEVGDYGTMKRISRNSDQLSKSAKRLAGKLGISACEKDE
jgi:hypothetical protein